MQKEGTARTVATAVSKNDNTHLVCLLQTLCCVVAHNVTDELVLVTKHILHRKKTRAMCHNDSVLQRKTNTHARTHTKTRARTTNITSTPHTHSLTTRHKQEGKKISKP